MADCAKGRETSVTADAADKYRKKGGAGDFRRAEKVS
jgi:hypothetical protein